MKYLIGIIGIIVVLLMAWAFSKDKKKIKYRPVVIMIVLQFILAAVLLNTNVGNILVGGFAKGFEYLLSYAAEGINFV